MKVKKGWLAVHVGLDGGEGHQRFVIPIAYLYHPLFNNLLDKAHDVYGYHTAGPLLLPCSAADFLHLRRLIQNDSSSDHRNHPLSAAGPSLSFRSC